MSVCRHFPVSARNKPAEACRETNISIPRYNCAPMNFAVNYIEKLPAISYMLAGFANSGGLEYILVSAFICHLLFYTTDALTRYTILTGKSFRS